MIESSKLRFLCTTIKLKMVYIYWHRILNWVLTALARMTVCGDEVQGVVQFNSVRRIIEAHRLPLRAYSYAMATVNK